jgi:hypothetical protein
METPIGLLQGETENVSVAGAYVRCDMPLEKSDLFSMAIAVPDHAPLEVGAEVVWVDIYLTPEYEEVPVGIGVRIIQISDEDSEFLHQVVLEQAHA